MEGPVSALFTTSNPKVEFQVKPITFSSHINGAETWRRPVNQAVNIKITPGDTPRFDKLASQVKKIFVVFLLICLFSSNLVISQIHFLSLTQRKLKIKELIVNLFLYVVKSNKNKNNSRTLNKFSTSKKNSNPKRQRHVRLDPFGIIYPKRRIISAGKSVRQ